MSNLVRASCRINPMVNRASHLVWIRVLQESCRKEFSRHSEKKMMQRSYHNTYSEWKEGIVLHRLLYTWSLEGILASSLKALNFWTFIKHMHFDISGRIYHPEMKAMYWCPLQWEICFIPRFPLHDVPLDAEPRLQTLWQLLHLRITQRVRFNN